MHLASAAQSEIRITVETLLQLTNDVGVGEIDTRETLTAAEFPRAASASASSIDRLEARLLQLRSLVDRLPSLDTVMASTLVNEELTELSVSPSIADHDAVGPHLHWTPATARFDDQVVTDFVMALAQELCEHGTDRFGRCAATDCDNVFYDATRNHSRRFCADPRCASRTHTASHRARQRS